MHYELRAILDRFIYEHAGIRHLLAAAPPDADTRTVRGADCSTVDLVAHFALAQEGFARAIQNWLADDQVELSEFQPNCEGIERASASRAVTLERYAASLRALFDIMHQVDHLRFEGMLGREPAKSVLVRWVQHQLLHVFPFVEVLPETRYNPVIVNWLARAAVPNEAVLDQQKAYIADVREYYSRLADEEDDE